MLFQFILFIRTLWTFTANMRLHTSMFQNRGTAKGSQEAMASQSSIECIFTGKKLALLERRACFIQ